MKILSVDDNVENLYLLEAMLTSAECGYQLVSARNGVEALQKLEHEKFDLIIADILMPQMDGFELCRQVKQRENLRRIPLVFYTATYTEKKDEALGLRLGASRFIVKPVDPDDFLAIIREVIQEHEAGQLAPPGTPVEKEEVLLKAYNLRLVRKLDQKVQQLEHLTQKLEAVLEEKESELVARRRAEAEVRRLNTELEERVRQRTAELATANSELDAFASAVSHDLRAPLRAMEGLGHVLSRRWRDKLDEQGRYCLDNLQAERQRMDQLIEALLQLSRGRRAEIRREAVNLTQLARDIEGDLRREQPDRCVDFRIAPDLAAQADPVLLRSALRNLLSNAWKFTAKVPEARIEFGQVENEGRRVYFVSDNGAGFEMEGAEKLFEPFQRLHAPSDFPGTGVGLSTVQQIVRRHGGTIWAESAAGKGATFYFTLQPTR